MRIYHYKILIKNLLPEDSTVDLKKTNKDRYYFKIITDLSEKDFDITKNKIRDVIGENKFSEFYTQTTGQMFYVYLK